MKTKFTDYDGFCEKFVAKKTTDDCYTPPEVYAEVLAWLGERVDLQGRDIVRPFYPNGDYQAYDYPAGCVVIDNPPFSIYAEIVRFYLAHKIDFFLFAPALTQPVRGCEVCYVVTMATVIYANGANVRTSFTTNLFPAVRIMVAGDLTERLESHLPAKDTARRLNLPSNVVTCARLGRLAAQGVSLTIRADECAEVRKLDGDGGKSLFGIGFFLSEQARADKDAAEAETDRRIRERAGSTAEGESFPLSSRERAVVEYLTQHSGRKNNNKL